VQRALLALASCVLKVVAIAPAGADGQPATTAQPIDGLLVAVGPGQRSLTVVTSNLHVNGCRVFGVTSSVMTRPLR